MIFLEEPDFDFLQKREALEIKFSKPEPLDDRGDGRSWWRVRAYISGDDAFIENNVDRVVYHTHPTFPRGMRRIERRNSQGRFSLSLQVWGRFTLRADVYLKNGDNVELAKVLPPLS
jgi:transcription initiation factor IIF auxiliary subunit